MWKLKSMGQYLLKMDIGHRWDVLKLTFWVSSDDGTILERLPGESLNGGQFTCTSGFFFKSKMLVAAQWNYPLTMSRDCFASFERIILTAFIKGNSFSPPPPSPFPPFLSNTVEKLPVVHTECRGFWKREGRQGDNEKKSMGTTLFDVFFLLTAMVLNLSSTNICV